MSELRRGLKPRTRGKDCHPQAGMGKNGEYGPRGSAMVGEIPQGLYRSPVVEGTTASSAKRAARVTVWPA